MKNENLAQRKIRYAIVGLGWIAQEAVLPAFANAPNSELVALVTDNAKKAEELSHKYSVKQTASYGEYEGLLSGGEIDAVYIALPNSHHREYAVRAARGGVHVLCEKPMAETALDCIEMNEAAEEGKVKLMIAYRLHFEEANLEAIETIKSGKIGEARFFNSIFTQPVVEGNVRLKGDLGGGPLMDMGVYCINAARYLFQDEPTEVMAFKSQGRDPRFQEVPETVSALLNFPGERLASFTCSFGTASTDMYQVVGTKGDLRLEPGYTYHDEIQAFLTVDGKTEKKKYPRHDQFGAELLYFSQCILEGKDPQPSGKEGLADVRIIRAIMTSLQSGQAVTVDKEAPPERPGLEREIKLPTVKPPNTVEVTSPTGKT